jgi:hypothetical protein
MRTDKHGDADRCIQKLSVTNTHEVFQSRGILIYKLWFPYSEPTVRPVKLSLCSTKHYAMKAYGGVDIFLTSALVGGQWSASRPGRFTPCTHWIGGSVGPRTNLDDVEKILDPTGTRTPTARPSSP